MPKQKTVVWEWQEEIMGQWIPYDPGTCHEIEIAYQAGKVVVQLSSIPLLVYEIDLTRMTQINVNTGCSRSARRTLLSSSHALSKGVTWEWSHGKSKRKSRKTPSAWESYSTELIQFLEENEPNHRYPVSLPAKYKLPYMIDFKKNTQVNTNTGFERDIRRTMLKTDYPRESCQAPASPGREGGRNKMAARFNYPSNNPSPPIHGSMSNPHILRPGNTLQNGTRSQSPTYNSISSISIQIGAQVGSFNGSNSNSGVQSLGGANGSYAGRTPSMQYPTIGTQRTLGYNASYPPLQPTGAWNTPSTQAPLALPPSQSSHGGAIPKSGRRTTSSTGAIIQQHKPRNAVSLLPCPADGIPCNSKSHVSVSSRKVLKKYSDPVSIDPLCNDSCAICQSKLTEESGFSGNVPSYDAVKLKLCQHIFHEECMKASYKHGVKNGCIVCPACNKMHGEKTGNQPDGRMFYEIREAALPGYPYTKTIKITYDIPSGIQTEDHPHPGNRYHPSGFPRIAYLPDTAEGREVLSLLIDAWKRRLIFTVGQSSTSGRDDCVTWTGIHHKTEITGKRGHGYPDEGYLDRVKSELEAAGVVPQD